MVIITSVFASVWSKRGCLRNQQHF